MNSLIRKHFPSNKEKWKIYLYLFLPMMLGSTLFALNGFVDNFMVGHISQGTTALSAVNSWTGIIIGIYVGTAAAGSISMARYYFAKDYEKAKNVLRFRIQISIFFALLFVIAMLSSPTSMIQVFLKENKHDVLNNHDNYHVALENSKKYGRLMTIQWILMAISFNLGTPLREIGHGRVTVYYGIGTLTSNIILNAILMYGLNLGITGAAWATITARIVAILWCTIYMIRKKIEIRFKFWQIYIFSSQAMKDFAKNWFMFVAFSSTTIFIIFRSYFYDAGYTVSSNGIGNGVGAMSVLALTGAIANVFTTTLSCLASMSANVVGSELGKGNTKQAKINGFELKGFVTTMSFILSVFLVIFVSLVPYMYFLSRNQYGPLPKKELLFDSHAQLISVRNSTYVIAFFYPIWTWFSASYRIAASDGKGKWFAFTDWVISGPLQLGWVAIIMLVIVPHSVYLQEYFWASYALFFLSDFIKLFVMETLFYKLKWNKKISKKRLNEELVSGEDEIHNINKV